MQSEWDEINDRMVALKMYGPMQDVEAVPGQDVRVADAVKFLRSLPDESVDLVFTDEPYGIKKTALSFSGSSGSFYEHVAIDWDDDFPAHLSTPWVLEAGRVLKPGGMLVNSGFPEWSTTFREVVRMSGLVFKGTIAWLKPNSGTQVRKVNYKSAFETFWWASKGKVSDTLNFQEQMEMRNYVVETVCPKCRIYHPVIVSNQYACAEWMKDIEWPEFMFGSRDGGVRANKTQKPEWLATKMITIHSSKGDLVVDPFCGSGTYLAVAHSMGREVAGCDTREDQVDYTKKRIRSKTVSLI